MSRKLIVFSGAGLSADSGLSTFRSADGLWNEHKIDDVCNIHRWKNNMQLVHRFYGDLRKRLEDVEPNAMHKLLARWQTRYGAELITQNIDNLLERAGATNVMHVHGFLTEMECQACGRIWDIQYSGWDPLQDRCQCGCRKGVKPHVVFFGEAAPLYKPMLKAFQSVGPEDVVVVIGTDGAVVPIGSIVAELECHKLLNTLNPVEQANWQPGMVHPALFNHAIYARAKDAVDEIDRIVTAWMEN
jgi:NAD-dependent deacetylase